MQDTRPIKDLKKFDPIKGGSSMGSYMEVFAIRKSRTRGERRARPGIVACFQAQNLRLALSMLMVPQSGGRRWLWFGCGRF